LSDISEAKSRCTVFPFHLSRGTEDDGKKAWRAPSRKRAPNPITGTAHPAPRQLPTATIAATGKAWRFGAILVFERSDSGSRELRLSAAASRDACNIFGQTRWKAIDLAAFPFETFGSRWCPVFGRDV
jgi:hypothetical protein